MLLRARKLGICSLILSLLLVLSCIISLTGYNTEAQIHENTLESVTNKARVMEGIAQINTGETPVYIYGSSAGGIIYVANSDSNTVSVIDETTNTVIQNIPVGKYPHYIYGHDPRHDPSDAQAFPDFLYVANADSDTVSVVDTTTNTVIKDIPVGRNPLVIYGYKQPRHLHGDSDAIYVANWLSNTVTAINTTTNTVIKDIPVGKGFKDIYGDPTSDVIYVSNSASDTVSVVNTTTNTVMKDIPVADDPFEIVGDPKSTQSFGNLWKDALYVVNRHSDTVTVINTTTNTVVKDIPVGSRPSNGYIDSDLDVMYVAHIDPDAVSIINTTTNTVVKDIKAGDLITQIYEDEQGDIEMAISPNTLSIIDEYRYTVKENITVGLGPVYIYHDPDTDAIYVANSLSGGVSVISTKDGVVVAGVTFDISPFRGGDIICRSNINRDRDLEAPIGRYFYMSSGSKCIAKPSKGFEFSSWVEVFEGNSTRTVNATSSSPWAAFLDAIYLKPEDPAATLTVNRFGNFTAYFRALPPAIPTEYLAPLYAIVVSTVVGLSIPSIVTWRRTKKQTSRLNSYHQEMNSLYGDGKLDESDIDHLNLINKNIINGYSEGKINNEQYSNLKNEISVNYEKIFKKRIDALKESSEGGSDTTSHLHMIKEDIRNAFSEGKITELHYNLLNERIAELTSKNDTPK